MIETVHFENYLKEKFGNLHLKEFKRLGAGVHGTGFLAVLDTEEGPRSYVIKELGHEGLGHVYPSDRAGVFLLAYNEYGNLPNHVKAIDVLSLQRDGSLKSIAGGIEYFLMMELGQGESYFTDLNRMKDQEKLTDTDKTKIHTMVSYLAAIHQVKGKEKELYYRKLRDTIGHGECLMGVLDYYPEGVLTFEEMAQIERKCVDRRALLKPKYGRLCEIHGDFHPGNLLFTAPDRFCLLDRSRGPWGDAADDVTALTINYIFFSLLHHGVVDLAFQEALELFYELYLERTKDREILEAVPLFYAFRAIVVANPVFYPEMPQERRKMMFSFINKVLGTPVFDPWQVSL